MSILHYWPLAVVACLALFLAFVFLDHWLFDGSIIRAQGSPAELKKSLELVLAQKDRPFSEWPITPFDWIHDKMEIRFKNRELDALRENVAEAIHVCTRAGRLNEEAIHRIQEAIGKLDS